MSDIFDSDQYLFAPKFDAPGGLSLAQALLSAAPPNQLLTPKLQKAIKRVQDTRALTDQAYQGRLRAANGEEQRQSDTRVDHHWAALHDRIAAWTLLDSAQPNASRAQSLLALLFPDGLAFLRLAFQKEWAEGQRRLDLIDRQNLVSEVNELAGSEFLSALRVAHRDYGSALGITTALSPDAQPSMTPLLRDLASALEGYARQLLATFEPEVPAELAQLRSSLKPLDDFRANAHRARPAPAQPQPAAVTSQSGQKS